MNPTYNYQEQQKRYSKPRPRIIPPRARAPRPIRRTIQPRQEGNGYAYPKEYKPVPVEKQNAGDILDSTQVWTPTLPPLDVGVFIQDVMNEPRFRDNFRRGI